MKRIKLLLMLVTAAGLTSIVYGSYLIHPAVAFILAGSLTLYIVGDVYGDLKKQNKSE